MKQILYLLCLLMAWSGISQTQSDRDKQELYKNYREDQFYISITYNVLNFKTSSIAQTGFSPGLHLGFIRDMPINQQRNLAIGLGLGLSANAYNQNLAITESGERINFGITDNITAEVSANRFSTYLIEIPLEFRWRTSTPTSYSFWRIYAGIKVGYMFHNSTVLKTSAGDERLRNIDVFNRFQYGLTLSAGFNTWNFHINYNLSSFFNNESQLNGAPIDLSTFKIGLIFFIL